MLQAAQKQRRKVGTLFESRTYFNIYDVGEIYLLYSTVEHIILPPEQGAEAAKVGGGGGSVSILNNSQHIKFQLCFFWTCIHLDLDLIDLPLPVECGQ